MKRVKAFKADTNAAKTILGAGQAAGRLFVGFFCRSLLASSFPDRSVGESVPASERGIGRKDVEDF